MNFRELMSKAKSGDKDAVEKLLQMYSSLITKKSTIGNTFDEDLNQNLKIIFLKCIKNFSEKYYK